MVLIVGEPQGPEGGPFPLAGVGARFKGWCQNGVISSGFFVSFLNHSLFAKYQFHSLKSIKNMIFLVCVFAVSVYIFVHYDERLLMDDLVKSPFAALRGNFVIAAHL
jgi:hypothetical protein